MAGRQLLLDLDTHPHRERRVKIPPQVCVIVLLAVLVTEQVQDRYVVITALDKRNGVARLDLTFVQNTKIDAWTFRIAKFQTEAPVLHANSERIAGNSRCRSLEHHLADQQAIKELSTLAMRCGGCGAKVGATVLSRVMQRLPEETRDDVLIGRDAPDDCAMLAVPEGKVMVQSVDYFRAFIDDPYTFGRIAANHALGDIFAMGADAQSALAIATVPYGREQIVEQTLSELMSGALDTLAPTGAVLAGGHSSEGAELAFGLTVNGLIARDALLRKGGMQPGDTLILTKPIGTGTLFAADMRGKAKGRWVDAAIQSMLVSNQAAAACLHRRGATACTDVTGFGLLGHLVEMTRASNTDVHLDLEAVPLLDGAEQTVAAGILSSLQPQNVRLRRAVRDPETLSGHARYPLLFDPQTAGGLLASVPADAAAACLDELHQLGYAHAAIIGRVEPRTTEAAPIQVIG